MAYVDPEIRFVVANQSKTKRGSLASTGSFSIQDSVPEGSLVPFTSSQSVDPQAF